MGNTNPYLTLTQDKVRLKSGNQVFCKSFLNTRKFSESNKHYILRQFPDAYSALFLCDDLISHTWLN